MPCTEEESRTERLLGAENIEKLHRAHIAVFGVGGAGGYVCEVLARAGVGALTLIDGDRVSRSNINRQIIALHSTVGHAKVDVMKERIADINPACRVTALRAFYLPENADSFPLDGYSYVVDAVDHVGAKLELAERCFRAGIPIISAMGAGNKLDPMGFRVSDIGKTEVCPLARVMRRELRSRGVPRLKCVWSPELPKGNAGGERFPASVPFVPSVAGILIASEVIRDLCEND